jgi:hypothetical protein
VLFACFVLELISLMFVSAAAELSTQAKEELYYQLV